VVRSIWRSRWLASILGSGALLAVLFGYRSISDADSLESTSWLAAIVSVVLAWLAFVAARPGATTASGANTAEQIKAAVDYLVAEVEEQWRGEARARALTGTTSLDVRWSLVPEGAGELDDVVRSLGLDAGAGKAIRVRASGRVREIADDFRRLRARRAVIVGTPGSGKTSALVLLTIGLAAKRQEGQPVPVLLSLASWDLSEKFSDWVVGQLNSLYPELQNRARFGAKAAEALVRTRRVITLLDGLDEMAPDLRGGALAEINRWLVTDGDAVVSCRSDEYQEVLTAGGEPLRSAPVIVLEDVSPDSAGEYMSGDQPSAWRRVIGQLAANEENGSLRDVLGNPLMISLARRTYGAGGERVPDDLVDLATTSTGEQVRRSLLEAIVPVAFRAGADNKMISREWASRKARRWLVNLAQEAGRTPDAELRWWQLPSRGSILSQALTQICLLAATGYFLSRSVLVAGALVIVGMVAPLNLAWGAREPRRMLLSLAVDSAFLLVASVGRSAVFVSGVSMIVSMVGTALVIVFSCLFGSLYLLASEPFPEIGNVAEALLRLFYIGAVGGASVGFSYGVFTWMRSPESYIKAATPRALLNSDRRVSLALGVAAAAMFLVPAVTLDALFNQDTGVVRLIAAAAVVGAVAATSTAWGRFCFARIHHAARGRYPLRLLTFLDDARSVDVLRQAGGAFQFRHRLLQEHLVEEGSSDG
jgi:hypothetical protein